MSYGLKILAALALILCHSFAGGPEEEHGYVDIHFHANAYKGKAGDLPKVAEWMEKHNVSKLIVPQFKPSLPTNEKQKRQLLANFKKYKGKIYRYDVIPAQDVSSEEEAIRILKKMKAEGAIGFGEHYGKGLFIDDPKCMHLYAACEEVGLPVLFHSGGNNNKDDANLTHLENALKAYPKCNFIAHGPGTWAKMKALDKLLGNYKNLYADISANSGAKAIGRNKDYSRKFMIRHADQVLFGTDGGPWSFDKDSPLHFQLVEGLKLPKDVKAKLCRENALRLFNIN